MASSPSPRSANRRVIRLVDGRRELLWRDVLRVGRVSALACCIGGPHGRKQRHSRSQPPVHQCLPPGHAGSLGHRFAPWLCLLTSLARRGNAAFPQVTRSAVFLSLSVVSV